MFGLGEMLCKMTTYRLSVRATEQTTVLQIQSQKLRSVIEKYHPKVCYISVITYAIMMVEVNRLINAKIYYHA